MAEMTYGEMLAKAREVFGSGVELDYDADSGWIVRTEVRELVDMSEFAGTLAMAAYEEYEGNYGSTLERWAYKNGQHGSLHQICVAFNERQEAGARAAVEQVRGWVAEGREFGWEGGPEYRDGMLRLGEERGW